MNRCMKRLLRGGTAALLVAAVAVPASAEDWPIHGGRARGLGGAGVALERNQLWNPGMIGLPIRRKRAGGGKGSPLSSGKAKTGSDFMALDFGIGVDGQFEFVTLGNVIRDVDDIADVFFNTDYAAVQGRLNAGTADAADIQTALTLVDQIQDLGQEGKGLYGTVVGNGEAHVHTPAFTIGLFGRIIGYAGVSPEVNWAAFANSAFADGGFADVFGSIGTFNTPATTGGSALSTSLQNNVTGMSPAEADELAFQAEAAGLDVSNPDTINALIAVAQATVDSGVNGLTASSSLFFNQSGIRLRGVLVQEGGVTLATSFEFADVVLSIGVSGKVMEARTNNNLIAVSRLVDGEQALDKLLDDWNRNEETLTTWSVDAGAALMLPGGLTIGVSGRNLTRPVFAFQGPQSYYLTPQVRAGVAYQPIDWVTFTFDSDLWATGSRVADRYHSQLMGGGVELNMGAKGAAFIFRLGAYRNAAEPDEAVTYTTGLGFLFGPLEIDLAIAASLDQAAVENADDVLDSTEDAGIWNFAELYPERFGATATATVNIRF